MVRMIALAAALLAGVFVASTAAAQQFPPHRFFGTVTVNGQAASSGTTVTAMIGDAECGTTTVTSGGAYVIDVSGVTINPNCGRSGQSTVSFEVGGQAAAQTATYRDGGYQQLNLTVGGGAQPSPTPAPTGTPRPTATPAPTAAPTTQPSPTAAPTARPTASPAATPKPQAPSAPAAAPAQRPTGAPAAAAPAAAAPAAQRPAAAAAPAALPRTGTGGLQSDTSLTTGWMLAGGALAVFGVAGMALALRTSRRSRS